MPKIQSILTEKSLFLYAEQIFRIFAVCLKL